MKAEVVGVENFSESNFILKLKPMRKFDFAAGQFVMIKVCGEERPFSIASHPSEKFLEFLIKEHKTGKVSPCLIKMKKGDVVEFEGPFGAFNVRETKVKELVFIATGTGVAPFRAMVIDALERFPDKKVTLIFGFRFDFYFEKIWKSLQKKYNNFNLVACCSRAKEAKWKGKCGHVTDYFGELKKNPKDKEIYICGSEAMVGETRKVLIGKFGFNAKQIRVEEWKAGEISK